METAYFVQHSQCSRTDKQDLLYVVRLLMELATHARNFGLLDLDRRINANRERYNDMFLCKAVHTIADLSDPRQVRKVLENYIVAGNYNGGQFLKNVVITETCAAMILQQDLDYIFSFLVPSYFGLEFDELLREEYQEFKKTKNIEEAVSEES